MKNGILRSIILISIFCLFPINASRAITQNQINAEVQIVCPDNYGNLYSGSGTIIDPKGVILTNKHVVTDEMGSIIKTCAVGFMRSISEKPDFGTTNNINVAEVKYWTTNDDMDAAILYFDNKANVTLPYINIWDYDSNNLKFGDKLEVVGFPAVGGSTITYSSGDFSGFGSIYDGTGNYIKTTAPLEHGNSGGSSYNLNGNFVGIPSMVVAGSLNSISYILSVNSIKKWLSNIVGGNYQQTIVENSPQIEKPINSLKNDITPPNIKKLIVTAYSDRDSSYLAGGNEGGLGSWWAKSENPIYFTISNALDESGIAGYYVYFGTDIGADPVEKGDFMSPEKKPVYYLKKFGTAYLIVRAKDNNGNISDKFIFTYLYDSSDHTIHNIDFYDNQNNIISSYNWDSDVANSIQSPRFLSNKNIYIVPSIPAEKYLGNYYYKLINENDLDKYKTWVQSRTFSWGKVDDYVTVIKDSQLSNGSKIDLSDYDIKYGDIYYLYIKAANYYSDQILTDYHKAIELIFLPPKQTNYVTYKICNIREYVCPKSAKSTYYKNKLNNETEKKLKDEFRLELSKYSKTSYKITNVLNSNNLFINYFNAYAYGEYPIEEIVIDIAFKKIIVVGEGRNWLYSKNLNNYKNNVNAYLKKITPNSSNNLSGKIVLQVESHGEAWYVNPKDGKRYYMADGNKAYGAMRGLGVGITNKNLDQIKTDKIFAKKFSGQILLQIESHGEAWYIDFSGNAHYLKNGATAYEVMRSLGVGITNNDLNKITEGNLN